MYRRPRTAGSIERAESTYATAYCPLLSIVCVRVSRRTSPSTQRLPLLHRFRTVVQDIYIIYFLVRRRSAHSIRKRFFFFLSFSLFFCQTRKGGNNNNNKTKKTTCSERKEEGTELNEEEESLFSYSNMERKREKDLKC